MQLVDSHCHLNLIQEKTGQSIDTFVANAKQQGVSHILNVSVELSHVDQVIETANRFDNVFSSVGLHPCYHEAAEPSVDDLIELASQAKVVAIGESGLDYHTNHGVCPKNNQFAWQRERFKTHIEAAIATNKPLIVHCREAIEDTLSILSQYNNQNLKGIMHCYVDDIDNAMRAIDLGFYISFSGIVSFKNALELQQVAQKVPLENILIETDAPYLAPVPYRGKLNQPAYVYHVAEKIAELKPYTIEQVAQQTSDNFFSLMQMKV